MNAAPVLPHLHRLVLLLTMSCTTCCPNQSVSVTDDAAVLIVTGPLRPFASLLGSLLLLIDHLHDFFRLLVLHLNSKCVGVVTMHLPAVKSLAHLTTPETCLLLVLDMDIAMFVSWRSNNTCSADFPDPPHAYRRPDQSTAYCHVCCILISCEANPSCSKPWAFSAWLACTQLILLLFAQGWHSIYSCCYTLPTSTGFL